ncbi:MAG: xanthine dehydrogenase family protein molybdopterin-binding subunit [Rhodospirillaceae bacterium]
MTAMIGKSPLRKEDLRLLTGRGRYADDNVADGQAIAVMVASPHAHAGIRSIDAAAALAAPGVIAVLTGADWLADGLGPIPHNLGFSSPPDIALQNRDGSEKYVARHFPLPADKARHVGEPVAMVLAETLAQAKDAAELVAVDYAPLRPIVDTALAAEPGAPLVWDELGSNVAIDADVNDPAPVEAAFAAAAHVVRLRTPLSRVTGVPMEPRCAIGEYGADGRYTLQTTAGGVIRLKTELAKIFGVPPDDIRVVVRDAGGSYGPRNAMYVDHPLVLWAARRIGRPVKWTADRTECLLTDYQARDLVVDVELALDGKGRFVGFRTRNISNVGAHSTSWLPLIKGVGISTGLYDVGVAFARAIGVQTNTPPTYPYRSAGRPEVMYALERLIDLAAAQTGIDRLEIRRRNLIPAAAIPFVNAFGMIYESGDFPAAMETAVTLSDWAGFAKRREAAMARGRLLGIGISNYADLSTGYPKEWTEIDIRPDGRVGVQIGTMATGQGHETSFAQMIAEVLQVPFDAVDVRYGDTDRVKEGGGSHSGRSMRMGAIVICDASEKLIERGRRIASHLLEAAPSDIEYGEGVFTVAGTDRSVDVFAIAAAARDRPDLPDDLRGPYREESQIHMPKAVIGSGCHVCEVEIDPETGVVEVVDWTAVDDVGRAINPMTLDGQTHGGVLQGIGQALMEDCAYDRETGQMIGATFMDYALPRADTVPAFRTALLEVPTPSNPLGVKPGSEGGTAVAPAAVANAIVDALSGHGVTHIDLPATPERIWRAIAAGRAL